MKNLTTGIIATAILAMIVLGCSNSDNKSVNTSNTMNTTANSSSNDKANSNVKTTAANTSTASANDKDIVGDYTVNGKNAAGVAYDGDLTIKKQDEVYEFSWNAGGSVYDGVGVRDGDLIAVGYGAGNNGKGCGAAIYRLSDDTLDGKLGMWGYNTTGTQTAKILKYKGDSGSFAVTGTDTDGTAYQETLEMKKVKEDFFQLAFKSGTVKFSGTGIKVGDQFGVGIGFKQCGYVVYALKGDSLTAAWGIVGADTLGTETATRK